MTLYLKATNVAFLLFQFVTLHCFIIQNTYNQLENIISGKIHEKTNSKL